MAKVTETKQEQAQQSTGWFSWLWGSKPKNDIITSEERAEIQQGVKNLIAKFNGENPLPWENLSQSTVDITKKVESSLSTGQKRALDLKVEAEIIPATIKGSNGWFSGLWNLLGLGQQEQAPITQLDTVAELKTKLKGLEGAIKNQYDIHVAKMQGNVRSDYEKVDGKWVEKVKPEIEVKQPELVQPENLTQSISSAPLNERKDRLNELFTRRYNPPKTEHRSISDNPDLNTAKKQLRERLTFKQRIDDEKNNQEVGGLTK